MNSGKCPPENAHFVSICLVSLNTFSISASCVFAFCFGRSPGTELFPLRGTKEISSSHTLDVRSETWE